MRSIGNNAAATKAEKIISQVRKRYNKMLQSKTSAPEQYLNQYNKLRWAVRELAFSNPKIDLDELVFVKRQWPKLGSGHQDLG